MPSSFFRLSVQIVFGYMNDQDATSSTHIFPWQQRDETDDTAVHHR